MTALNFTEALLEWKALEKEVFSLQPKRLTSEQLKQVKNLSTQLDSTFLSSQVASMLRCLWVAQDSGQLEKDDLAGALWLASDLSDIAAHVSACNANACQQLDLHKQAKGSLKQR